MQKSPSTASAAESVHPAVRLVSPKSEHVKNRVAEIKEGKFDDLIEQVMQKPIEEMQELYNNREIEK